MSITAQRIKDAREAMNMSQAELAREVGITPVAVWQFENDSNKAPSLSTLKKISDVLKVSMDYLMGASDDVTQEDAILFRKLRKLNPKSKKIIQDMASFLSAKEKYKKEKK